jgi:hypothetical protein
MGIRIEWAALASSGRPVSVAPGDGVHPAIIDPMAIPNAASNRPRHRILTMVLPHLFVRRLAEMADWPDEARPITSRKMRATEWGSVVSQFTQQQSSGSDVGSGSKCKNLAVAYVGRSTSDSRHCSARLARQKSATTRHWRSKSADGRHKRVSTLPLAHYLVPQR